MARDRNGFIFDLTALSSTNLIFSNPPPNPSIYPLAHVISFLPSGATHDLPPARP